MPHNFVTEALERRSFLALAISAFPATLLAQGGKTPVTGKPVRVPDGQDRYGEKRAIGVSSATTYKVGTKDTNGGLFVFQHENSKKGGPPLHLHHNEEEWFYVLQGDYIAQVGSERFQLKAGDSLLGPREVPHTWAFVGNTPGRLLIAFAPANKMEAFFTEPGMRAGTYLNDAEHFRAYGMELIGPPLTVG